VLSTHGPLAEVEVRCLTACQACAAKSLCIGQSHSTGILKAENLLQADPGDRVILNIPEEAYTRSLLLLFGTLLISAVAGLGLGYISAAAVPVSAEMGGLFGLCVGIVAGGAWLARRFRNKKNNGLLPTIIKITDKGGQDG
jgi:positive regulator of sigma E activity